MPALVNNRQFGTPAYDLGRLPTQSTSFNLNLRLPRGPNDPAEDPSKTPSGESGSKGMGKGSSAGAKAGAVAGAGAGATAGAGKAGSKSMSLLQRIEEPFDPHSGVNQGFERQLQHAGHYIWDVVSPNSGFGHQVNNVMNFGNPFGKTPGLMGLASGGSNPVNGTQFGTSSSTVKSAVGSPQEGILGGLEHALSDVGEGIATAAEAVA